MADSASVDPKEIAKFAALAGEWWDPAGKFAPLHRLNPARLTFIRDRIAAHAGRDPLAERSLAEHCVLGLCQTNANKVEFVIPGCR